MSRELADITIKFNELEDVVYDELIEFLDDQNIQYEVMNIENRITDYVEEEPSFMEIWKEKKELGEI